MPPFYGGFLKYLTTILFILILSCEKPFYSKIYDESYVGKIKCLSIESSDTLLKHQILKYLDKNLLNQNCKFSLVVYSKYLTQCNNPQVKAFGADFDGYIRLTVVDKEKNFEIYRIQTDFKGYPEEIIIKKMILKLEKDLEVRWDLNF